MLWRERHLRLFCLRQRDLRRTAQIVSCQQDIAADGAFSLALRLYWPQPVALRGTWRPAAVVPLTSVAGAGLPDETGAGRRPQ